MPATYVKAIFYTITMSFEETEGRSALVFTLPSHISLTEADRQYDTLRNYPPEMNGTRPVSLVLVAHDAHPTRTDTGVGMVLRSSAYDDGN